MQDLLADEVDPGHLLGDGVLDLDARVHLHEVVVAVRREQALDRPRRAVAGRARRVDGDLADPLAQRVVDRRRRASPRSASGGGAGSCSRARRGGSRCRGASASTCTSTCRGSSRYRSTYTAAVGEVLLALALSGLERPLSLLRRGDELHPLAAAARRGLDDQRVADLLAEPERPPPPSRPGRSRRG